MAAATFSEGIVVLKGVLVMDPTGTEVRIRLAENGEAVVYTGTVKMVDATGKNSIMLVADGGLASCESLLVGPLLQPGFRFFDLNGSNPGEMVINHYLGPGLGVQRALEFRAQTARLAIGMKHMGGLLAMRNSNGDTSVEIDSSPGANIRLGTTGSPGRISIRDAANKEQIVLDGTSGDIVLKNGDCAEEFETACGSALEAGTVVVFDDSGRIGPSLQPYDSKVAGVVAGGGNTRAAIVLGRSGSNRTSAPIALMGKVECKATAREEPICCGDLLTTSPISGRAMRASDARRAHGAILGKAIGSLESGDGMVPMLVALR
jgi:hypothetical protein